MERHVVQRLLHPDDPQRGHPRGSVEEPPDRLLAAGLTVRAGRRQGDDGDDRAGHACEQLGRPVLVQVAEYAHVGGVDREVAPQDPGRVDAEVAERGVLPGVAPERPEPLANALAELLDRHVGVRGSQPLLRLGPAHPGRELDEAAVDQDERTRRRIDRRRVVERDVAAPRVADEHRPIHAELPERAARVGDDGVEVVAVVRLVGAAVAALVERDDAEARCEPGGDLLPDLEVGGEAVQQRDRRLAARPLAVGESDAHAPARVRCASRQTTPCGPTVAECSSPGGRSSRSPGRSSTRSWLAGSSKAIEPLRQITVLW